VSRGVALIGAGYWGSRLARNLAAAPHCSLRWVCDLDGDRATVIAGAVGARPIGSLAEVLGDSTVEAVVVATPARTHPAIVAACLEAGRHVLVEKPLAGSVDDARALSDLARERGVIVMCDHTYRFAPVVGVVQSLLAAGVPGALRSVDSVRTNHMHGQSDVGVLWDLAHHDLSILGFVLPAASRPVSISASSADRLGIGRAHVGDLAIELADGATVRVHVDWCAPRKVRTMTFEGDAGALRWDDLDPAGAHLEFRTPARTRRIPVVDGREPLSLVVDEFLAAIAEGRAPGSGPTEEIAVLSLLEAATCSDAAGGTPIPVAVTPIELPTVSG
jgi:predicted dehydrogenase